MAGPDGKEDRMRKLMVPIDGSGSAMHALDHAIALAKDRSGVELSLLNVHPDPVVYGEIQVYVPLDRVLEEQRKRSEALLAPAVEKVQAAGVPYTTEIESGDAATTIARRADALQCDGIVMGTRGMGAVANLLLGSVAAKVVHLANMPVTLVK
jgi:nucleotide-binding universal stress UspA family protein